MEMGKAEVIIDNLVVFLYVRVQETKGCNLNLNFKRVKVYIDGTTGNKSAYYSYLFQKFITHNTHKTFF